MAAAAGVAEALHLLLAGRELLTAGKRLPLLALPRTAQARCSILRQVIKNTPWRLQVRTFMKSSLDQSWPLHSMRHLDGRPSRPARPICGRPWVTVAAPLPKHHLAVLCASRTLPAHLLVVGLQCCRRAVVDNSPDVGLVNA